MMTGNEAVVLTSHFFTIGSDERQRKTKFAGSGCQSGSDDLPRVLVCRSTLMKLVVMNGENTAIGSDDLQRLGSGERQYQPSGSDDLQKTVVMTCNEKCNLFNFR